MAQNKENPNNQNQTQIQTHASNKQQNPQITKQMMSQALEEQSAKINYTHS